MLCERGAQSAPTGVRGGSCKDGVVVMAKLSGVVWGTVKTAGNVNVCVKKLRELASALPAIYLRFSVTW